MELNLLKVIFLLMTFFIIVIGITINCYEKGIKVFTNETLVCRKYRYNRKMLQVTAKAIVVPRRWFRHFYVFASVLSTSALILMLNVYSWGHSPVWVIKFLDFFGSSERKPGVSGAAVLVALSLLCIHTWRRLYETTCISVFTNGHMNIVHYAIGFIHYTGVVLAILIEAPGVSPLCFESDIEVPPMWDVDSIMGIGICLFGWAWCHQFIALMVITKKRKINKGVPNVVKELPKAAKSNLCEAVSSPHMFCEMLIYFGLSLILRGNSTWPFIYVWVVTNQMETALLSDRWNPTKKDKFKDYPMGKSTLIPFVL